ncbi:MAG: hypothetical protein ACT4P1_03500 [Sporichthyaceae bacterium]
MAGLLSGCGSPDGADAHRLGAAPASPPTLTATQSPVPALDAAAADAALKNSFVALRRVGTGHMRTSSVYSVKSEVGGESFSGGFDVRKGRWLGRLTVSTTTSLDSPIRRTTTEIRATRNQEYRTVLEWPARLRGRWLATSPARSGSANAGDPVLFRALRAAHASSAVQRRPGSPGLALSGSVPTGWAIELLGLGQRFISAGVDPWELSGTAPIEIDLDTDGLPRHVRLLGSGVQIAGPEQPPAPVLSMLHSARFQADLFDFDTHAEVETPPALLLIRPDEKIPPSASRLSNP